MNWAADLNLPLMSEKKSADVLFWVGDGAFDMRNQRTLRAFVKILKAAAVDFAVLGLEERDSGDVARRLGDEATFQNPGQAQYRDPGEIPLHPHRQLRPAQLPCAEERIRRPRRRDYQVLHHSTFIDELLRAGTLHRAAAGRQRHLPRPLLPGPLQRRVRGAAQRAARTRHRGQKCNAPASARAVAAAAARADHRHPRQATDSRHAHGRHPRDRRRAGGRRLPQCTAMLEGVVAPRPEIRTSPSWWRKR